MICSRKIDAHTLPTRFLVISRQSAFASERTNSMKAQTAVCEAYVRDKCGEETCQFLSLTIDSRKNPTLLDVTYAVTILSMITNQNQDTLLPKDTLNQTMTH